jgi:hypothetical protein
VENFIKTILSGLKNWTNEKINGKIKESTADWNQNDSNANNYIKNKPFIPIVDSELSETSNNAVSNSAVTVGIDGKIELKDIRLPTSANWTSVCYGDGKFVAVSHYSNIAAYSTDGINWTQSALPSSEKWESVCYGNGKYVAVANGSNISAYSTDGINWTQSALPSSKWWRSVCYGNGKYVAVANGSNISAYSTDGINWTQSALPLSKNWNSVCYGDGKFVAVVASSSNNIVAYSTDGINWTQSTLPITANLYSVCYGDGKYVAVASNSNIVAYSTDGINWTDGTLPSSNNWYSVCYGDGKFVAVKSYSNIVAYSTDGINWTQSTLPTTDSWNLVCYGDGKFVAVVDGYDRDAAYSTDGINWINTLLVQSNEDVTYNTFNVLEPYISESYIQKSGDTMSGPLVLANNPVEDLEASTKQYTDSKMMLEGNKNSLLLSTSWDVCYGNGRYVAIAFGYDVAMYSDDGINWSLSYLPSTNRWKSICYGDGKFVAVSRQYNSVAYSTDGINWTEKRLPYSGEWWSVCYGDGKFVAVARNQNTAAYSTDGITWETKSLPVSASWCSVCYGNGKFVAVTGGVGSSSIAAYSTDGINWTQSALPSYDSWQSVCYGDGKFIAVVGAEYTTTIGKAAYSIDGINWLDCPVPVGHWREIYYGNGKYILLPKYGNVMAYSTDGFNWTEIVSPTTEEPNSVCYGDSKFVAVSSNSKESIYSKDGINWMFPPSRLSVSNVDVTEEASMVIKPYLLDTINEHIKAPRIYLTLTDEITGLDYFVTMQNGNLVSYRPTQYIEVTTMPINTPLYFDKEELDTTGMVVTATDIDGNTREITNYTTEIIDYESMVAEDGTCSIPVIYVENNKVFTTTVNGINVRPFSLIDFEYTENDDGTYTLTDWKGTYNGQPSTKIIIPDSDLIIV